VGGEHDRSSQLGPASDDGVEVIDLEPQEDDGMRPFEALVFNAKG
jgi:hypothetical protein